MMSRRVWLLAATLMVVGCTQPTTTPPGSTPSSTPSAMATPAGPVASAPAPSASTAVPTATLSGTVYDEDQKPHAGVTVTARAGTDGTPITGTTGADGTYRLTVPTGASYQVVAAKVGLTARTQTVSLSGDATLNFGGLAGTEFNPYFLSSVPEIDKVDIKETAPGGPMTVTVHLSEPLPQASQQDFVNRLTINAGITTAFLTANGSPDDLLKTTSTWDAAGQVLTLTYAGPYLASGATSTTYTVRLRQDELADKDPITNEPRYEAMGIKDADGNVIGYNRAEYAFRKAELFPITYAQLTNKQIGDTPAKRSWSLTHQATHTFAAAKDETGPGLESVRVNRNMVIGSSTSDVLELHFNEPMWAVKDRAILQYTQLDKDKELVLLSVSTDPKGTSPQAFNKDFKVQQVRFSRLDPKVVYLHYSPDAFKDKMWVEVTLGVDMKDPAGNKGDSAKSRLAGPVS